MEKNAEFKNRSGSEKREKNLFIRGRVSATEKKEVLETLRELGISESEFVRKNCLKKIETKPRRMARIEDKLLAQILAELGKIGSNVNQLAHTNNRGDYVSERAREEAYSLVKKAAQDIINVMRG